MEQQPPLVIVVQGPAGSGKSTLIQGLVQMFTGQKISRIAGPITVRQTRARRLMFIECTPDMPSMIDLAKVPDMVIMCANAHDWEMETFEYHTLLAVHGFPLVHGVITHLDEIEQKKQNRVKSHLNERWKKQNSHESSMFVLKYDGVRKQYDKNAVKRFSQTHLQKSPKHLRWREAHPFVLADRIEAIDDAPTSMRLFGYVLGSNLRPGQLCHIPGLGDVSAESVEFREDPCPILNKGSKRGLGEKDKLVYAPMSDIAGMERVAGRQTITISGEAHYGQTVASEGLERQRAVLVGDQTEGEKIIAGLHTARERAKADDAALFASDDDQDESDEDVDMTSGPAFEFASDDSDDSSSDSDSDSDSTSSDSDTDHDLATPLAPDVSDPTFLALLDALTDVTHVYPAVSLPMDEEGVDDWLRDRFITGEFGQHDRDMAAGDLGVESGNEDDEEEGDEKDGEGEEKDEDKEETPEEEEDFEARYMRLQGEKHALIAERNKMIANLPEAQRVKVEGYRPGSYVCVLVTGVDPAFFDCFDPTRPVVLGGLGPGESAVGQVHTRIIRHPYHRKILKNGDPAVISMGWRRFQTRPIFSMEDPNGRQRQIKYTPEHMHCFATFHGPLIPPNYGVAVFQSISRSKSSFRVSATGTVLQMGKKHGLTKKLKLIGTPFRAANRKDGVKTNTMKNSAFIKGMFNSELEVNRFVGAKIRTVSGIRGIIKKAEKAPPGAFRATFEDKILLSDIVFLRGWVPVEIPAWCLTVATLLQRGNEWAGMKTTREVRDEKGVAIPVNKDSLYSGIIERKERVFSKTVVPKKIATALPFGSKVEQSGKRSSDGYLATRHREMMAARTVAEKARDASVTHIQQLSAHRRVKRADAAKERVKKAEKAKAGRDAIRQANEKERRKAQYRRQGLNRKDAVGATAI
ncbi:Protein of unknown function (DUF663) [Carpediemonas membranifera]|uniref:Bms1-type G domain-containing protein n=1 Tax=Carpediemonas membranifera TaxID=201153 RepID=A0A8J6B9C0_9EUKA|nr:Protein of unknown function (DUF663) [Carpediemonas membranifera]|eukprot:KAG9395477.1 Protein of unknown function (DUF663) [Carpediemonas membranifera]